MSPSEFTVKLTALDERLRSLAFSVCSLLLMALVCAPISVDLGFARPLTGELTAAVAVLGVVVVAVWASHLKGLRDHVYDDIVLSGFRHVRPQAVQRRIQQLRSHANRRRLATTLERFTDPRLDPWLPVPIERRTVRGLQPRVRRISAILRDEHEAPDPAGIVLLSRLLFDGSSSPLFGSRGDHRQVARQLDLIEQHLAAGEDELQLRRLAARPYSSISLGTPRRSSPREMTSRWISLVPSQMRSTRSSRHRRSAGLRRM